MYHLSKDCSATVQRIYLTGGYLFCTGCRELLAPKEVGGYVPLHFLIWADPIDSVVRHWHLSANQVDEDDDFLWGNFESQVEAMAHAEAHLSSEQDANGRSVDCPRCTPESHPGCTHTNTNCILHSRPRRKAKR